MYVRDHVFEMTFHFAKHKNSFSKFVAIYGELCRASLYIFMPVFIFGSCHIGSALFLRFISFIRLLSVTAMAAHICLLFFHVI